MSFRAERINPEAAEQKRGISVFDLLGSRLLAKIEMYVVYIITNTHSTTLYVGVTNDLIRRIREHKIGFDDGFSKRYHLSKLIYYEEFSDINQAIAREKQIKSWSRDKKEQLISKQNPEWKDYSEHLV